MQADQLGGHAKKDVRKGGGLRESGLVRTVRGVGVVVRPQIKMLDALCNTFKVTFKIMIRQF